IISVYAGAADKDAYEEIEGVENTRVTSVDYSDRVIALQQVYQELRDIREEVGELAKLNDYLRVLDTNYLDNWLATLEILEIALDRHDAALAAEAEQVLAAFGKRHPELDK